LPEIERDHPIMEPNDHQKYEGLWLASEKAIQKHDKIWYDKS
jgi:hypothetical protein